MSRNKYRRLNLAIRIFTNVHLVRRKLLIGKAVFSGALLLALGAEVQPAWAQQKSQDLEIVQLRPNFYMIAGAGGNIALETGPDGSVLVDAGSAESADRVIAAIKRLTKYPVRYIIDTTSDADHVGGNGKVSKGAGQNVQAAGPEPLGGEVAKEMTNGYAATIMSTEQVLFRMSAPTGKVAAFPNDSWPVETIFSSRKTLSLNGDAIEIFHMPSHTDGESIVFFRHSDVVVAGDALDMTRFPRIDLDRGGSIEGEIATLNKLVELTVVPLPFIFNGPSTYVVPGHGRACEQIDVVNYRDMVVTIRDIIQDLIKNGKTLEQVKAAKPAEPWASQYGSERGSYSADQFVEAVYKSLKGVK